MARCRADKSIERTEVGGFAFPLGVYPIEDMKPREGYTVAFEPADGSDGASTGADAESEVDVGDDAGGLADPERGASGGEAGEGGMGGAGGAGSGGEWEEWPDRYVFDILVSATRVEPLCRALFAMFPGRIYPILDVLGHDEFREVDPYVSYELIGQDRFLDAIRRYRAFFYEDGLVGFGAMSDEPFMYIFVDEHKIVTVRVEVALRERVEGILSAFDLAEVEEIAGADAATHEHRGVLDAPDDRPDLLTAEEIVEDLRDDWKLVLNVDPEANVNDEGEDLGITAWRCIIRCEAQAAEEPKNDAPAGAPGRASRPAGATKGSNDTGAPNGGTAGTAPYKYAEVLLTAGSLNQASDLAFEGLEKLLPQRAKGSQASGSDPDSPEDQEGPEPVIVAADRVELERFQELVKGATGQKPETDQAKVWHVEWLG